VLEPINFIPEETTIWSFPNRGNWATHSGEYRGNWSPYIKGNVVPLGFRAMNCFKKAGFILKEIIIKEQHNCRSTGKWLNANRSFLLLAHEYIFVLYK